MQTHADTTTGILRKWNRDDEPSNLKPSVTCGFPMKPSMARRRRESGNITYLLFTSDTDLNTDVDRKATVPGNALTLIPP